MATYEQLVGSSFSDVVVPFKSENGLGVINNCTNQLTGYSLPVTEFTFTAELSSLDNTYIGASMDKLIWDLGDGTFKTGVSVSKHYQYPGIYNVTCIFTDQNGVTHKNRLSQEIKVYNYIPDSLVWYTPVIADPNGGRPERCFSGIPSNELTIYRMNSWQSWPTVSGDGGYYINLYATGSKSKPLSTDQYWKMADSHLTPCWRFLETPDSTVPVERVQTDVNDYVYVKKEGTDIIRVPSTTVGAIFAGTSGSKIVHYMDDNPNRLTSARDVEPSENVAEAVFANENLSSDEFNMVLSKAEDKDIILYAAFDTSKFPVTHLDSEIPKFELLKSSYFQIYETQKVGLPIQVKFNYARELHFSSNGIDRGFEIKGNKFIDSPMSMCVRTEDLSGNLVNSDDVVPLSSRWVAPTTAFSGGDITTDTLTAQGFISLYLSGADSTFTRVKSPFSSDEDFKIWDIGDILPENEVNKYVRIVSADRDGTTTPEINGKTIKILFSELVEEQQEELKHTKPGAHAPKVGTARDWITKSGSSYYGYIALKSNFADDESVRMELVDVTESFDTPGSYLCFSNLTVSDELKLNTEKKYRYYGHTLIDPPLTFSIDVTYYYITNPTNDWFWQIKPTYYREYSYGDDGLTQTYTPPISTTTPGNSGMYGMAVDPLGDVIAVDGDTDKIIRYWRNRTLRSEISIRDLLPEAIRANHYPDNDDAYGYTPSSVALDKQNDYWITLYDTLSTVKMSGETNEIIAVAVPPEASRLADIRTAYTSSGRLEDSVYKLTEVNGRPGEYGEDLIKPTTVDTCVNNDIVVTYTNPLCSFIARYSPVGEFLYKYEFPDEDRYFTGDVTVDVSDHVWAVTESTGLNKDGSVTDEVWSEIYSFDEELDVRLIVSSLEGTDFQDMLKPTPHKNEEQTIIVNMDQEYDYERQKYYETGLLVEGYGNIINPQLTLYEGDTYHFENQYFNNGQHPLKFQEMTPDNLTFPLSTDPILYDTSGQIITHLVSGLDTSVCSITLDKESPDRFLLVDQNYPNTQTLVLNVIKKPVINSRQAETFNKINNAGFIVPDNNNHIWFSWGRRYCSRYNHLEKRIDTTVAVGSAYDDEYFDIDKPETYDRRANAARRSAIEGISMDTANNLLVINNHDKVLYAINSDNPTLSAYINVKTEQIPYEEFEWVESLNPDKSVEQDDFMLYPDSYMTEEQIKVFLSNTHFTGTDEQKMAAYQNYISNDDKFRHAHGAFPVSATGFEEEICAYGDWTGYRWINKYDDRPVASDETTGFVSITGCSDEFILLPQTGTHEVAKINEDIDFAGVMREYMQQPVLKENPIIYNDLMNTIFGTNTSGVDSLGKRIYERISNYVTNHTDVDTCTIRALYGLAEMIGYKMLDLGYSMPVEIQRLIDLLSINYNRLRGMEYVDQTDFEKYGNWEQNNVGVNLGNEILFIFDWDPQKSYGSNDFVHHEGEYYESRESMGPGNKPKKVSRYWKRWPDGQIRSRHMEDLQRLYPGEVKEQIEERYYAQNIRTQMTQNLEVHVDKKYVVKEEHTGQYTLVNPVAISVEDRRDFRLERVEDHFVVSNANFRVRLDQEHLATNSQHEPIYTIEDDVVTMFGRPVTESSTILLFRNRTYKFDVDSIGHPIIITTHPGPSAEPVGDYVSGQYTEYGKIVIKTDDHPIYGPIPEKLYYQSTEDPKISGTLVLKYVEDVPGYDKDFDGLKTYNLNLSVSSHNELDRLGWGLSFPEGGNAWQYYTIYEYIEGANKSGDFSNNVIDWESTKTTINPADLTSDTIAKWEGDAGFMDVMIDKALRSGLNWFDGVDSLNKE